MKKRKIAKAFIIICIIYWMIMLFIQNFWIVMNGIPAETNHIDNMVIVQFIGVNSIVILNIIFLAISYIGYKVNRKYGAIFGIMSGVLLIFHKDMIALILGILMLIISIFSLRDIGKDIDEEIEEKIKIENKQISENEKKNSILIIVLVIVIIILALVMGYKKNIQKANTGITNISVNIV